MMAVNEYDCAFGCFYRYRWWVSFAFAFAFAFAIRLQFRSHRSDCNYFCLRRIVGHTANAVVIKQIRKVRGYQLADVKVIS